MLNAFGMYIVDLNYPPSAGFTDGSGSGIGVALHGSGAPGAGLGDAGDTYVDDDTGGLWWKSTAGWHP